MRPQRYLVLALLIVVGLLAASCSAPTPAAPAAAKATSAPAAPAAQPTAVPATKAPAAPTTAPAAQPTAVPATKAPAAPTAAAAAPTTAAAAKTTQPEKLVILHSVDAETLDPNVLQGDQGFNIAHHIFDQLVKRGANLAMEPMLAESWTLTDDLTWTFKLRKGVTFHNGEKFNAEAAKFSMERAAAIPTWGMKQASLDKIEVVDEFTLKVTTKEPRPNMLTFLLEVPIFPPKYYGSTAKEKVATQPIGSGPYKFVDWVRDDHATLEAFPEYWGGAPAIKTLLFRVVPEASTRIAELETGKADIIVNVPPDQAKQVEDLKGIAVAKVNTGRRINIGMRHAKGPLADTKVRQAINYAVNVDTIVSQLMGGNAIRMTSVLNAPYLNPDLKPFSYDPEKAKKLLAEAGYANGFKVILQSPNGRYLNDIKVSQAVAADLAKVGIQLEVQPNEWTVYIDKMNNNKLDDMWFMGFGAYYEGALELNNWAGGFENFTWNNEEFKKLWTELGKTMDDAKRKAILYKIQDLMIQDPPILMLYKEVSLYGIKDGLEWGLQPGWGIYLHRAK